jgi:hypothetical protein
MNDPKAVRKWLLTLWPYNPGAVQADLAGDGFSTFGMASITMPQGSMSLSTWAKPRVLNGTLRYLVGVQNGAAAGMRALRITASNTAEFRVINDAGTAFAVATSALTAGVWTHLAGVLDTARNLLLLYQGGVQVASTVVSGAWTTALANFTVLRQPDAVASFFPGEISEVLAWSTARTLPQVQPYTWTHGLPVLQVGSLITAQSSSLTAYFRLNDGTGATAVNSLGSSPNLALTNAAWGKADWGAVLPHYFSLGGFNSGPTDTPASQEYAARLLQPPIVHRSMFSGAAIGGSATPDYGEAALANTDGGLDVLKTYSWDGRRALLQFGGILSYANGGTSLALTDYATVFDGLAGGGDPTGSDAICGDQQFVCKLRSKDAAFDKAILASTYTPPALRFTSSSDRVDLGNVLNQTGSLTIEGWVYSDAVTAGQRLLGKDDGTNGWAASIADAGGGSVRFITRGLSNVALDTTGQLLPNTWAHVAMVFDATGHTKTIYVNGVLAASSAATGTLVTNTVNLVLGNTSTGSGGTYIRGRLSEVRLWSVARTQAQIVANMRVYLLGSESGLVLYSQLDEGKGIYANDSSASAATGILYGSPAWDIADWAATTVAGKTLPYTYGEVLELEPANPDPVNLIYQVHDRNAQKIQAVYDKGAALTPPVSYSGTDVVFTSGTKTVAAAGADYSSLVVGQLVTISGSAANSGDKTVATVAADGHSFTITGAITTEAAGPAVTVVTKAGTNGYTVDLTRGLFTLTANPAGKITCWVRGDSVGGYVNAAADLIRRAVTRHGNLVDPTDLDTTAFAALKAANGAACGIYIFDSTGTPDPITGVPPAAGRTLKAVVDELAGTVGAFFGFSRMANLFQVGRFEGVSGSPVLSIDYSTALVTDGNNTSVSGVSYGVQTGSSGIGTSYWQALPSPIPTYRVIVAYAHNYIKQSEGDLVGVALSDPVRRSFATKEWRYAKAEDLSVLDAYPNAPTLTILSNFVNYADAYAEAVRLLALLKLRRDPYAVLVHHTQAYTLDINQPVTLIRSRFGLDAGKNFQTLAFDEQVTQGCINLTVWG